MVSLRRLIFITSLILAIRQATAVWRALLAHPLQEAANLVVEKATVCGLAPWTCSVGMGTGMHHEHGHAE